MVIGFKKQFVKKILDGTKIHTIREDKYGRLKTGMAIHMATGVRTKKYKQFALKTCTGVAKIYIDPIKKEVKMIFRWERYLNIKFKEEAHIKLLAKRDGFNSSDEFWLFFNKPFIGKIIFWTKSTPFHSYPFAIY